jgi:hypothetical protein
VVLRLLDHSQLALRLDRIGMNDQTLKSFSELIRRPQGMTLITVRRTVEKDRRCAGVNRRRSTTSSRAV